MNTLRRFMAAVGVAHHTVVQPPAFVLVWRAYHEPRLAKPSYDEDQTPNRRCLDESAHKH